MSKKVYAITVSKNYPDQLRITIPKNIDKFHKWFVVTQEDDEETVSLLKEFSKKYEQLQVVYYPLTPMFQKPEHQPSLLADWEDTIVIPKWAEPDYYGCNVERPLFDKGGAIRTVQRFYINLAAQLKKFKKDNNFDPPTGSIVVKEDDLILILDSDILLPDDFNSIIDKMDVQPSTVYGAEREDCVFFSDSNGTEGTTMPYHNFNIDGYFQLYKYFGGCKKERNDSCRGFHYCRSYNAGLCDFQFTQLFDQDKKITLRNIVCKHLGVPRVNWNSGDTNWSFVDDRKDTVVPGYIDKYKLVPSNDESVDKHTVRSFIRRKVQETNSWKNTPCNFVFIPGFERCGTQALENVLSQHPHIEFYKPDAYSNGSTITPEIVSDITENMNLGLSWAFNQSNYINYKGWVPGISKLHRHPYQPKNLDDVAPGDKYAGPQYKYILTYRDPTERAISEFSYFHENLPSSLSWDWPEPVCDFWTNIADDYDKLSSCPEIGELWRSVKSCESGFLANGMYFVFAKRLADHVGYQNVLVLNVDKFHIDPLKYSTEIFNFLNVTDFSVSSFPIVNPRHNKYGVSKSDIVKLNELYKEPNAHFIEFCSDYLTTVAF